MFQVCKPRLSTETIQSFLCVCRGMTNKRFSRIWSHCIHWLPPLALITTALVEIQADLVCGWHDNCECVVLLKVPSSHGAQIVSFVRVAERRKKRVVFWIASLYFILEKLKCIHDYLSCILQWKPTCNLDPFTREALFHVFAYVTAIIITVETSHTLTYGVLLSCAFLYFFLSVAWKSQREKPYDV